ncbi:MAG: alpha/beta hydrolase [Myxococcota bacterium]
MSDARPRSASVTVNGLRLHYLDWGEESGVPALAFHGFALNCHSWDEVAPMLGSRLRIHAFDQRGHGLSDRGEKLEDYTRDHMVRDIEAIVDSLGLSRPVVIGHSMGGMNAMTFAARNPDKVRALVLVDVGPEVSVDGAKQVSYFVAGPYELDSLEDWVDYIHEYYPWRSKQGIRARLELSLRRTESGKFAKQYDERFRQAFGGIAESEESPWQTAERLRCPTLLVHGRSSPVLPLQTAQEFERRVDCVRLVSVGGAGHSVAGDQPDAFVRAVSGFLEEVL